ERHVAEENSGARLGIRRVEANGATGPVLCQAQLTPISQAFLAAAQFGVEQGIELRDRQRRERIAPVHQNRERRRASRLVEAAVQHLDRGRTVTVNPLEAFQLLRRSFAPQQRDVSLTGRQRANGDVAARHASLDARPRVMLPKAICPAPHDPRHRLDPPDPDHTVYRSKRPIALIGPGGCDAGGEHQRQGEASHWSFSSWVAITRGSSGRYPLSSITPP